MVVAALVGLSLVLPFFWCRYLCPYGALVGALSVLSPFKIRRDRQTCIGCRQCTQICPARVRVHEAGTVRSDECHACLRCIDVCPVERTLRLSAPRRWISLSKPACAAAIILVFVVGVSVAQLAGYWHNAISAREYRSHLRQLGHPAYMHNRGTVPAYDWDKLGIPEATKSADRVPSAHGP
jgi:polyferredoxin